MNLRRLIAFFIGCAFLGIAAIIAVVVVLNSQLPQLITLDDYKPLLVSEVYGRHGEKIGEFYREKRTLVPFDQIPKVVANAFIAAEDSTFYEHSGINYVAIFRAVLANLRAGEKVQGASTITQQVARSLMLSRAKKYSRKIKEVLLSYKMEEHLSKQDILYLYLNQIFLGHGAYGVAVASEVYFNKPLKDITLPEAAILAGLPKAPSAYAPLHNPKRAKERQLYVLSRMAEEGMITHEEAKAAGEMPIKVYERQSYWDKAPHFLETVRQMLIAKLGEEVVLDQGIQIYTSLDLKKQQAAQESVQTGLRALDKRQGYRGPVTHLEEPEDIAKLLLDERNRLLDAKSEYKMLMPDGTIPTYKPLNLTGLEPAPEDAPKDFQPKKLSNTPDYMPVGTYVKGIVTKVDDTWGLVSVRFAESKGIIDVSNMEWARTPDPDVSYKWAKKIEKPGDVLKKGDVIELQVIGSKFSSKRLDEKLADMKKRQGKKFTMPEDLPEFSDYAEVALEQKPVAQAALLAIDQHNSDVISMVGGYEFSSTNQLNRSLQAVRQTGSAIKPFIYLSALDKGFTPSSQILDAPIVYEQETELAEGEDNGDATVKKWKPTNDTNRFLGDILFRNALIKSMNVPTVKVIEKIGVPWAADYIRRLGVFSPLNMDFTLALGSSSLTLYEMTKAYAELGRIGRRIVPMFIHKVTDQAGNVLLENVSLDERFHSEVSNLQEYYKRRRANYMAWKKAQDEGTEFTPVYPIGVTSPEATTPEGSPDADTYSGPALPDPAKEPPFFMDDPDQLIKPQSAYVLTSLLEGVVNSGTGQAARILGRPTAGKTGTTSNYYDAWFMGFTAEIATGVWVGFDQERSLGRSEFGATAALPIWVGYMKEAHEGLPVHDFHVPDDIIFANIDNETGRLASANSKEVVKQAFVAGTEPKEIEDDPSTLDVDDAKNFFKEDLSGDR